MQIANLCIKNDDFEFVLNEGILKIIEVINNISDIGIF